MRRYSLRRAKLNRVAAAWRQERLAEVSLCDICGERPPALIHEIARGQHRAKALMARFAQLLPCQPCHDLRIHKGMSVAEQLAWLHERRFAEFDIEAFYKLTDRRWPDQKDIWQAVLKLRAAADGLR